MNARMDLFPLCIINSIREEDNSSTQSRFFLVSDATEMILFKFGFL